MLILLFFIYMTKILTFTGPSCVWKTTISERLVQKYSDDFSRLIAFTTRERRPDEIDEKDYYFLSPEEYFERKQAWEVLQDSEIYWNYYGYFKNELTRLESENKVWVAVLDVQWVKNLFPYADIFSILLLPESQEELQARVVRERGDDFFEKRFLSDWDVLVWEWKEQWIFMYDLINKIWKLDEVVDDIRAIFN